MTFIQATNYLFTNPNFIAMLNRMKERDGDPDFNEKENKKFQENLLKSIDKSIKV
jgi:hypothetical protein